MTDAYKWYQLFFPENIAMQKVFLAVWWVVLAAFLLYLIRKGAQQTGVSTANLIQKSTEDVQLIIDKEAKNGVINGVPAPKPVYDEQDDKNANIQSA